MPRLRYAGWGSRDSLENGPPAIGGIAGPLGVMPARSAASKRVISSVVPNKCRIFSARRLELGHYVDF